MVRAMNVKMSDSYADLGPSRNEVEELRLSELRHRFLAESASDVVWSMGLDGTVTYVSPAVENVLGYTAEETMQMSFDELLLPDSKAKVDGDLSRLRADMAAGRPPQGFRSDLKQRKKDGSIIWTEVIAYPLTGSDGSLVEIVGVTRDICARKKYEHELEEAREAAEAAIDALASVNAKLRRLATTDDLTGATNRRRLEDAVEAELARARRTGQPVALIMFDIDYFKRVNDSFGHQIGDRTLVELTHLVSLHLRSFDVLARWGGEEFIVMAPNCDCAAAMKLAERLRDLVAEYRFPEVGQITVSLGVTEFRADERFEDGLKRVDDAMYQTKNGGRNAVCRSE